ISVGTTLPPLAVKNDSSSDVLYWRYISASFDLPQSPISESVDSVLVAGVFLSFSWRYISVKYEKPLSRGPPEYMLSAWASNDDLVVSVTLVVSTFCVSFHPLILAVMDK